MTIYDYGNQNLIDYKQITIGLFFLLSGFFCFKFLSKYKPEAKEDFSTRFLGLSKNQVAEKINTLPKIAKMMGIILFLAAGLFFFIQIKSYVYVKNIRYFENVKSLTARIDSVQTNYLFGSNYLTLYIKNKSFFIVQDKRYLTYRNLLINDSIKIEYFENKFGKSINLEVVKIELK